MKSKSVNNERLSFSIDERDKDGDVWEHGLYLHVGPVRLSFENSEDFKAFWIRLQGMQPEIDDNFRHSRRGPNRAAIEADAKRYAQSLGSGTKIEPPRPTLAEVLAKVEEMLDAARWDYDQEKDPEMFGERKAVVDVVTELAQFIKGESK